MILSPSNLPDDAPLSLLISPIAASRCAAGIDAVLGAGGWSAVDPAALPADGASLRFDLAYFTRDVYRDTRGEAVSPVARTFFAAVEKSPHVRWLQIFSAGADRPVFGRLQAKGISVTTASGASAPFVALTAFTGMLMLARGFPRWMRGQQQRLWLPAAESAPRDLRGARAMVVGTGPIGQEIARLCATAGLRTHGFRRQPGGLPAFHETHGYAELHALADRCDVLFLACPLTPQTRGLVDERFWSRVKPGCLVVNVARGEVLDETALLRALDGDAIAGAYLDVFPKEPLPADSPLWSHPKLVISPHAAAESIAHDAEVDRIFLDNLSRWHRGEPLENDLGRQGA